MLNYVRVVGRVVNLGVGSVPMTRSSCCMNEPFVMMHCWELYLRGCLVCIVGDSGVVVHVFKSFIF